jgi:hypothetical protein
MPNTLQSALGFEETDLIANRALTLSEAQRTRLQRKQTRTVLSGVVMAYLLALVATAFLFFGQRDGNFILSVVGGVVVLCNAGVVGMFAREWLRLRADLRADSIHIAEGTLERVVRAYGRGNNFVLRVGEQSFNVPKEAFNAFTHQAPYRLYYTAHARILLSAE